VYTHDIADLDELNEAYLNVSASYGMGEDYYVIDTRYVWVDVMHNFEAPMYYISYATSLIPALEIFDVSLENRERAIDLYNRIASVDPDMGFKETLEENGLADPFAEQTIVDIVNAIVNYSGVGYEVQIRN
jgi:oligoendopeptidase F